jgi:hypothetical protein
MSGLTVAAVTVFAIALIDGSLAGLGVGLWVIALRNSLERLPVFR